MEFRRKIQPRLPAKVGQEGIGLLGGDNFRNNLGVERFDIGRIRHTGIRHDGRRIGIHQDDFIPQGAQCLAGLRTGVVKLTGLSNNDGAGADD